MLQLGIQWVNWLYGFIALSKVFQSRTQRQDGKYTCIYVYIFKQIFVP